MNGIARADLIPYWGAVAQVIPVLALALVLEGRLLLRRFSKKASYADATSRYRQSLTFLLASFLLATSEVLALISLIVRPESRVSWLDSAAVIWSLLSVFIGLTVVLIAPISALTRNTTADVQARIWYRVPWSRPRRLRRRLLRALDAEEAALRSIRAERLSALLVASYALLNPRDPEEFSQVVRQSIQDDGGGEALYGRKTWERLRVLLANTADPQHGYKVCRVLYDEQVRFEKKVLKVHRSTTRLLDELDAMMRGEDKKLSKELRAAIALAGRSS